MNNIAQPFVNLTNSNIAAITRFAQSPEIAELANISAQKCLELAQKSFGAFPASGAHSELARRLTENYSTFAQEYAQNLMSMATKGQDVLTQQFRETSDQVAKAGEAAATTPASGMESAKPNLSK